MKKVLLVAYGGGHINTLIPVYRLLQEEKNIECTMLALTTGAAICHKHNLDYKGVKDFVGADIRGLGEKYATQFHNEGSGISYEETMSYYGMGINDLIEKYGESQGLSIFEQENRKAFLPVNTLKKIIRENGFDMVVATNSPRTEHSSLLAANELNIPAVRVQQFFEPGDECRELSQSVYFTTINEFEKNNLINNNIDENKIFVVGQPAFDELNGYVDIVDVDVIKNNFNIACNKKVVTWLTQKTPDEKKVLKILAEYKKENPQIELIIKLHPNEDVEPFKEEVEKYGVDAILTKEALHPLIVVSDVVLTEFSTAGYETVLLDKPLITINFTDERDKAPYAENGVALGAKTEEDVKLLITELLTKPELLETLSINRRKYCNDGKSGERIVNVIKNILKL